MTDGAYPKMMIEEIASEISKDTNEYIVKQLVSLEIDPDVLKKQAMEIQRLNAELDKMYQKGRADAIDEFREKVYEKITYYSGYPNCSEYDYAYEIAISDARNICGKIAEQMKERDDEKNRISDCTRNDR